MNGDQQAADLRDLERPAAEWRLAGAHWGDVLDVELEQLIAEHRGRLLKTRRVIVRRHQTNVDPSRHRSPSAARPGRPNIGSPVHQHTAEDSEVWLRLLEAYRG